MEITKKKEARLQRLLMEKYAASNSLSRMNISDRESLSEIIGQLTELKKDNYLSQNQLSDLIILACASFIESEVQNRISSILSEKVFNILEKK